MGSERSLWLRFKKGMKGYGDLVRIENPADPGTPDVNFCFSGIEGMLELKEHHEYPKRDATRVFGPSGLRKDQIVWILNRCKSKGRVFILAQVDADLYLVPGRLALEFNEMSAKELYDNSLWKHHGNMGDADWIYLKGTICGERAW